MYCDKTGALQLAVSKAIRALADRTPATAPAISLACYILHRLKLCRLVIVFDPGNSSIELAGTIHSSVVPAESG